MNELISVIVPIYNVSEYLDKCVETIVNQTYKNLEIILVDDGSTDDCPEKCEEWVKKDSRIKVVHKENGGLSDARNAGLEVANGSLIGYVDSDDYIDVNMYECLYKAILENDSKLSLCQFVEDVEGKIANIEYTGKTIVFTGRELVNRIVANTPNPRLSNSVWKFLYKREVIANIEFEKGRYYEDALYTMPVCINLDKIPFVDIPMYFYRQRSTSIMGTKLTKKHVEDMLHYQDGLKDLFEKNNEETALASLRKNQCRMFLEYRYLIAKEDTMRDCYEELSKRISELHVRKKDVPAYSTVKFFMYRYLPKMLAGIKR